MRLVPLSIQVSDSSNTLSLRLSSVPYKLYGTDEKLWLKMFTCSETGTFGAFNFYFLIHILVNNASSVDPDQTLRIVVPEPGLHYFWTLRNLQWIYSIFTFRDNNKIMPFLLLLLLILLLLKKYKYAI